MRIKAIELKALRNDSEQKVDRRHETVTRLSKTTNGKGMGKRVRTMRGDAWSVKDQQRVHSS